MKHKTNISVDGELRARIKPVLEANGQTLSGFVRVAIREYLKQAEAQNGTS